LRARIGLEFGAIALGLALVLGMVQIYQVRAALEAEAGGGLAADALQISESLGRGLFERYSDILVLAALPPIRDHRGSTASRQASRRELLEWQQQMVPEFSWIGVTDLEGRVLAATGGVMEGINVKARPWFRRAQIGPYFGDVREANVLAKFLPRPETEPLHLLDLAIPLKDGDGRLKGVLGAHLNFKWANEQALLNQRSGAEALVFGRDGAVLRGPSELKGQTLELAALKLAQAGKKGFLRESWPDGEYLAGFSEVEGFRDQPGFGWTVLVRKKVQFAIIPALEHILWASALGLLASAIGWMIAGRIAAPVQTHSHRE
jgi:hypothetical protein